MAETKELSKDVRDKIVDLQDHHQAAWWEGDNSWCDYSQMKKPKITGVRCKISPCGVSMRTVRNQPRTTRPQQRTMDRAMYRQGRAWASQGIDNGSWMGIPAWQWSKTHGQGNKRVSRRSGLASLQTWIP